MRKQKKAKEIISKKNFPKLKDTQSLDYKGPVQCMKIDSEHSTSL